MVSIIIPVWNQAQYLAEAIESALAQTHPDKEIIVIDDGSPDKAAEIAAQYPVRLVRQRNKGLASARNTGIMWAYGEYVLPLDSDDILKPECVERIVSVARETNADIIAPSIECFGIAEQATILMPAPTIEDFKGGNRIAYCSAVKRSVLLEVGGYSPRYDALGGWEDLALWYDLLTRGRRIVTIPEPLVRYRVKEKSMWRDAEKNKEALWEQIIKDFPHVAHHKS